MLPNFFCLANSNKGFLSSTAHNFYFVVSYSPHLPDNKYYFCFLLKLRILYMPSVETWRYIFVASVQMMLVLRSVDHTWRNIDLVIYFPDVYINGGAKLHIKVYCSLRIIVSSIISSPLYTHTCCFIILFWLKVLKWERESPRKK